MFQSPKPPSLSFCLWLGARSMSFCSHLATNFRRHCSLVALSTLLSCCSLVALSPITVARLSLGAPSLLGVRLVVGALLLFERGAWCFVGARCCSVLHHCRKLVLHHCRCSVLDCCLGLGACSVLGARCLVIASWSAGARWWLAL